MPVLEETPILEESKEKEKENFIEFFAELKR